MLSFLTTTKARALVCLASAVLFIGSFTVVFVYFEHHPVPISAAAPQATAQAPVAAAQAVPDLDALPDSTTYAKIPAAPPDGNQQAQPSGLVAHPRSRIPVFAAPGGPAIAALPTHEVSSDTWVPVVGQQAGWLQVLLPSRPNGSTGWLSTQDSQVDTATSPFLIEVDRSTFRLNLYDNGHQTASWTVGVGKPSAPTPSGRTFVLASIQDSKQTYSPVILPLGIHSTSHETFGGGPGTTGIHTWPTANVFGTGSSDGCIRVPTDALKKLAASVPLGTPVLIH
ncbi:L,D-transpeptidase [Amycolatopsis sp. CA-161197]|uniref:L,D-transpeptidase n=1 Tax=Amycolatopsis sp. CA-161197 TaxID=3239922 RepID=UPI003D8E88A4